MIVNFTMHTRHGDQFIDKTNTKLLLEGKDNCHIGIQLSSYVHVTSPSISYIFNVHHGCKQSSLRCGCTVYQ